MLVYNFLLWENVTFEDKSILESAIGFQKLTIFHKRLWWDFILKLIGVLLTNK